MRLLSVLLSCVVISSAVSVSPCLAESRVLVPSIDKFRRNGEGSLLTLNNGRLLLVYTQWYSGTGSDHDPARLVEIHSDDQGQTWSAPRTVQENVGKMNVMSASARRRADHDDASNPNNENAPGVQRR